MNFGNNSEFICIIVTVQSNLGNWEKKVNFGNNVAEIQQKYEREREKAWERKFWISAMASPKFLLPKPADRETNCGNAIAEIGKKKFCGNCGNAIAENGRKKKIVVAEITCEEFKKKSATFTIFSQQITGN